MPETNYELFFPPDNEEQRDKYVAMGRGGTCGPASIAAAEHCSVKEVLAKWRGKGIDTFRGFSPIKEMKETLTALGYTFKYVRAHKSKVFPVPETTKAIVRIQWLKPDGTEYYWRAAGSHTHYVYMERMGKSSMVFCNGEGWFEANSMVAFNYLEGRGYVSSYLELTKEK